MQKEYHKEAKNQIDYDKQYEPLESYNNNAKTIITNNILKLVSYLTKPICILTIFIVYVFFLYPSSEIELSKNIFMNKEYYKIIVELLRNIFQIIITIILTNFVIKYNSK